MSNTDDYVSFIEGTLVIPPYKRNIEQILNYSEDELEEDHSYIQWLFPLHETSNFNPYAPLLDVSYLQQLLAQKPIIIETITKSAEKMMNFWGIKPFDQDRLRMLNGHNGLRFSRVLQSLVFHGLQPLAKEMLEVVLDVLHKQQQFSIFPRDKKLFLRPTYDRNSKLTLWEVNYQRACDLMQSIK